MCSHKLFGIVILASLIFSSPVLSPIRLQDVPILIFEKNAVTTSRKNQFYTQLNPDRKYKNIDINQIVCSNEGYDGINVIWKCEAQLPDNYDLATTSISCEGWHGPGDEYIVPGSCSLDYSLRRTHTKQADTEYDNNTEYDQEDSGTFLSAIFAIVLIGLVIFSLVKCVRALAHCCTPRQAPVVAPTAPHMVGGANQMYPPAEEPVAYTANNPAPAVFAHPAPAVYTRAPRVAPQVVINPAPVVVDPFPFSLFRRRQHTTRVVVDDRAARRDRAAAVRERKRLERERKRAENARQRLRNTHTRSSSPPNVSDTHTSVSYARSSTR